MTVDRRQRGVALLQLQFSLRHPIVERSQGLQLLALAIDHQSQLLLDLRIRLELLTGLQGCHFPGNGGPLLTQKRIVPVGIQAQRQLVDVANPIGDLGGGILKAIAQHARSLRTDVGLDAALVL